jgi:hypothetical protein
VEKYMVKHKAAAESIPTLLNEASPESPRRK